ncbi:hypothetical protein V2A60_007168 [Cordyceps javanica]
MTAVVAGMRLILLILQEISKRTLLVDETQCRKLGIEATSGCISRTLFLFLQPVFATGFRTELLTRHLNELDPELSSEVLYEQLEPHWRPNQSNPSPHALLKPCLKAWKGCGVGLVFSRLVVTAFDFSRPFVLRRVIEMVDKPHGGPNNMKERLGVQGATACMFIGLALSRTTHAHLMNRYVTRVRGGLIGLMIHKEHRISEVEAKRSAAVTLMTADIDGIVTGIPQCLQIPIGLLEIALGTAVLSRFIGVSAFAVFAPLILTTAAAYAIAPWTAKRLARWNQGIQVRVAKTANILPHIATIKMLGLGPTVSTFLQSLREEEIAISKGYRLLQAISYGPILVGDLMTPVIVLAAALFGAALHGEMSAAKVFPILTVVSLIQQPLAIMLQTLSRWRNMLACFSRVQNFLCLAEKRDIRSRPLSADSSSSQSSGRAHGQGGVVRFRHAGIAPLGVKKLLLHNVHFDLPAGSITGLVGLTGSGKSTIVQTILGASEVLAGSVFVNTDEIGYCGENVWLRNSTIRENIIGDIEFNQARFTRVIRACFLEEDLSWLPGGADFVVGTNGSNLSGGQRQRVGIARTAYAEYPITIFDDAFSSLDHETAVVILHQLIGRNGIFRQAGCTVLVVTHLPTCLPLVNQLLVLEGPNCNILRTRAEIDEYGERLSCAMKTLNRNVPLAVEQREQRAVRTSLEGSAAATSEGPNVALRRKGDIRLYALFIRPIGWIRMILYTLFTSLFAAGEIIPEIYIRIWIETNPDKTTYFVGYASIGAATCVFGCLVYCHIPEDPGAVPALRDISLSILPGQHISIVGRSGSGKSSLFSTLLGFVYYEGRIKIDGVDIASISLNDLRSRLVTITQDQVQFDATIRTNLLPLTMNDVPRKSDGRSDEKTAKQDMDLEQLLKSLHIWLPLTEKGGLDAMLEDVGYSKGQVQLLCIARAILKQRETGSRVVLVDEATSSVDLQTERIVNQVVRENFAGCTVLTIAHRPTSIDGADGSICLHHGRLVDPDRGFSESEPEEDESGPEADESGEGAT